jgi:hypothetical protein
VHNTCLKVCICLFQFVFATLRFANIFQKKKTEKKESNEKGGGAKKPKGNGISPEG